MSLSGSLASPEIEGPFPRVLGAGSITAIVVGTMIGSGIFIVPATVAARVGSHSLIIAVWITGGILSLLGALALAELAAAYSETGGIYIYLREAYGPLVGCLFGRTLFLVIDSGSIAALAVAYGSKYLPQFVPMTWIASKGASALLIILLAAVNCVGVKSVFLSLSGTFEQLLTYVVFGHWIFMGLAVAALPVLCSKRHGLPRPYKALGYPVTPVIFVLAALLITGTALVGAFRNSFAGLIIILLGIPVFFYWKRKRVA